MGVFAVLFNAIGVFDFVMNLALPVFVLSLAAFGVSLLHTYVLTNGGAVMGRQMAITGAVIAARRVLR